MLTTNSVARVPLWSPSITQTTNSFRTLWNCTGVVDRVTTFNPQCSHAYHSSTTKSLSRSRWSVQAQQKSSWRKTIHGVAANALSAQTLVTWTWKTGDQTFVSASANTLTRPRCLVDREWTGARITAGVCAIRNQSNVVQIRYDHHWRNAIRQTLL